MYLFTPICTVLLWLKTNLEKRKIGNYRIVRKITAFPSVPYSSLLFPTALQIGNKRILLHAETCDEKQIAKGKYKQNNITLWDILSLPTNNGRCLGTKSSLLPRPAIRYLENRVSTQIGCTMVMCVATGHQQAHLTALPRYGHAAVCTNRTQVLL